MSPRDRDAYRPKTPPKGVADQLAAPEPIWDDVTSRYEGPQRRRLREQRPTPLRLAHIEERLDTHDERHDSLVDVVTDVRLDVREMRGEIRAVLGLVPEKQRTEQVRLTSRAKVVVGIATAVGVVAGAIATMMAGCM